MGYSLSVAFTTPSQRELAWAFLHRHDLPGLLVIQGGTHLQSLVRGEDLAYPPRGIGAAHLLGINASLLSQASWVALAFVASQVPGARAQVFVDSEAFTVSTDPAQANLVVDAQGYYTPRRLPGPWGVLHRLGRKMLGEEPDRAALRAWVHAAHADLGRAFPEPSPSRRPRA